MWNAVFEDWLHCRHVSDHRALLKAYVLQVPTANYRLENQFLNFGWISAKLYGHWQCTAVFDWDSQFCKFRFSSVIGIRSNRIDIRFSGRLVWRIDYNRFFTSLPATKSNWLVIRLRRWQQSSTRRVRLCYIV